MTGHTPWSEIKRKKRQNGGRLGEHRSPMPLWHWMVLVGVVAGVLALGANSVKAQEYEPYVQDTGIIHSGSELCFSPDLGQPSIELLGTWQRLVNELEAFEIGGPAMNEEDAILGQLLFDTDICHTVATTYHIFITQSTEGYVLARFDEQYGFTTGTFIVNKKDVLLDRGL